MYAHTRDMGVHLVTLVYVHSKGLGLDFRLQKDWGVGRLQL